MKNVEQLIADMKADEGLRKKFREGLNRLRSDETLSVIEAGIKVARELGYQISDDEAKKLVARSGQGKTQLNDDELNQVAGGVCSGMGSGCGCHGSSEEKLPEWQCYEMTAKIFRALSYS